jgi:hypothetical protein
MESMSATATPATVPWWGAMRKMVASGSSRMVKSKVVDVELFDGGEGFELGRGR